MKTVYLNEIRKELTKVLDTFQKDSTLGGFIEDKSLTIERIESLAGAHLFDDYSELFGITEFEGHKIRTYFQDGPVNGCYDFVLELHREFPNVFMKEREEYLEHINKFRKDNGLNPICFKV